MEVARGDRLALVKLEQVGHNDHRHYYYECTPLSVTDWPGCGARAFGGRQGRLGIGFPTSIMPPIIPPGTMPPNSEECERSPGYLTYSPTQGILCVLPFAVMTF